MLVLTGETLAERQRELNGHVTDAVARKTNFGRVLNQPNVSDIDVLFKIDLASRYKYVSYIFETLKSGDSLHITRALKSAWLFDKEYAHFINTDYLHHNILPSMSSKMKRKFLTTISMYVRNPDRAESFYKYCVKVKLHNIALKFLIFTSEDFKLEFVEQSLDSILQEEELYFKNFVGTSFVLAKAIMEESSGYSRSKILHFLRYLLSVSENEYLDLFEEYNDPEMPGNRFGLRVSRQILMNRKDRYLRHPYMYVERLNKNYVTKYINEHDAKHILTKSLPEDSCKFWGMNFCSKLDYVVKKIPSEEKFQFIKKIFNDNYPNEGFEMTKQFLDLGYHELMTIDEREEWALRHLETGTDIQGFGRNHLWYKFVNFEKSFREINILIAKTADLKDRNEMLEILIKTVRNQQDMVTLLLHYYNRHVNEPPCYKEQFICAIINEHDVFQFDSICWGAFNKILHSLKVYKTHDGCRNTLIMYMVVIYHIINDIDLPEALKAYILEHEMRWQYDRRTLYNKITKEHREKVYQRIVSVYLDEIIMLKRTSCADHEDDVKVEPYVQRYIRFLQEHKKSSGDCPPIIKEFVNANWEYFQHNPLFKRRDDTLTDAVLLRHLKKDLGVVVEKLTEVGNSMSENQFPQCRINNLLKKLRIYFPYDIALEYLNFFMHILVEAEYINTQGICNLVYGIFQLADKQKKIEFMVQYEPTEATINHGEIDDLLLGIQEGICKAICSCRPPVPLQNVLKYLRGDYLRFCLPIFQSYQAHLAPPLLREFVTSLIDSPVSIQKHALRLIFDCFSLDDLLKTIYSSWRKTKNVSVRFVLYNSLYEKICKEEEPAQTELFKVLLDITVELNYDDNFELFERCMNHGNKLPKQLQGSYIKICWQTVSSFPDNPLNCRIKKNLINFMSQSISLLESNFVKEIVHNHVNYMLVENHIRPRYSTTKCDSDFFGVLNSAKWSLLSTYIIYFASDVSLLADIIEFVRFIVNRCIEMWNYLDEDMFTHRQFCWAFIDDLIRTTTEQCCSDTIPIFETIMTVLNDNLPIRETYRTIWSLKLTILRRKVRKSIKVNYYANRSRDLGAVIRSAIYDYAIQVGHLVKECVEKNTYFTTDNKNLAAVIAENVESIVNVNVEYNSGPMLYENLKIANVLAAGGLTEVNTKNTYLLALHLLPEQWNDEQCDRVVDKIKNFDDDEVQFRWYDKFLCKHFKKRRLNI